MYFCYHETPIGSLLLAGDGAVLTHICFPGEQGGAAPGSDWIERAAPFTETCDQLDAYFAGTLRAFTVPLAPSGTPFQLRVLNELQRIPYGETRSYSDIARAMGKPSAQRAVGAANGRNPIPVIIPCHRVIGSRGDLVGFGGGVEVKRYLLDLEKGQHQESLHF